MSRHWTDLVSRESFIPDIIYAQREEFGDFLPVNRQDESSLWGRLVASDDPVVTQLDEDGWPTSSSSARWVMNAMLDALDLLPGQRVLEIGTGTGWNAAVMASSGAEVTTIEIDAELADHARSSLAQAGVENVVVIHGDGEQGVLARSPFDRVISTAAAHTVPFEWVQQTASGGRIVLPYSGKHHPRGLAVLMVTGDTASGQVVSEAAFMPLRGQRQSPQAMRALGEPRADVQIHVSPAGQRVTYGASD